MAPPVLSYAQVNGAKYSHCSLEFKLAGGFSIIGVKSINYKETLEQGEIFANSSTTQGTTRGRVKPTGDIELYKDAADALLFFLSNGGKNGFSETRPTFTVSYAETGSIITNSDILQSVRFHSPETGSSEGVEANTMKFQMHMMDQIIWGSATGPKTQLTPDFLRNIGRGG